MGSNNKIKIDFDEKTSKAIRKMIEEIVGQKTRTLNEEILELKKNAEFQEKFYEENKNNAVEVEKLKKEVKELKDENLKVNEELQYLTRKVNMLEAEQINKHLEVVGVPEKENESLHEIVEAVHKKLNIEYKKEDIKAVFRTKSGKKDCKNILIKTKSREVRDEIMKKIKADKIRLNARDINTNFDSKPIYINEILNERTKKLFFDCKTIQKEFLIKFIWISNGKVLARKTEKSKIKEIRHFDDLSLVKE